MTGASSARNRSTAHATPSEIELARARAACASATDPSTLEQARAEERRLVLEKFRTAASWRDSFAGYDRWRANEVLKEYARAQL